MKEQFSTINFPVPQAARDGRHAARVALAQYDSTWRIIFNNPPYQSPLSDFHIYTSIMYTNCAAPLAQQLCGPVERCIMCMHEKCFEQVFITCAYLFRSAIRCLVMHRFARRKDTQVTDLKEAISSEELSSGFEHVGKNGDGNNGHDDSHSVEYSREQMTPRNPSQRPSSKCIETVEGPERQVVMLRHSMSILNEDPIAPRPAPKRLLPDFEGDD
jgi:hypothetical protein